MTSLNAYALQVFYMRRKTRRYIRRTDYYPRVKAETEHEARLNLLKQYVEKGYRVINIKRIPPDVLKELWNS
jgi:hypothetical protein